MTIERTGQVHRAGVKRLREAPTFEVIYICEGVLLFYARAPRPVQVPGGSVLKPGRGAAIALLAARRPERNGDAQGSC